MPALAAVMESSYSIPKLRKVWDEGGSIAGIMRVARVNRPQAIRVSQYLGVAKWERFFDAPLSSEAAYLLGFIYADGCIATPVKGQQAVSISQNDKEFLHRIKKQLRGGSVYRNGVWLYRCSSNHMADRLQELGVLKNKTYKRLRIPDEITDSLFFHFLRGYFDGDGSISMGGTGKKSYTWTIIGGQNFIREVQLRIRQLTGRWGTRGVSCAKGSTVRVPDGRISISRVTTWRLAFGKRNGLGTLIHLMYDQGGLSLKRKRDICLRMKRTTS